MNRVLVLGGYGGFGARLSRRLAADGWTVIVAGRSEAKAQAFGQTLPGAEAAAADRNDDLAPVFTSAGPDLVIDAAGPFQGSSYRVAEACIAAGIHYFDLADASRFVCEFGQLDAAAKTANVVAISGASTLPALSSAVVAHLAEGIERIDRVDMTLSAAGATTASLSVAQAVLSYAGQVVPVWRGQRLDTACGAREMRRIRYAVEGTPPLRRLISLADVPDLLHLPERLPGRPAVIFRAGNDSALQMRVLALLARLVRLGLIKSLRPWASALAWVQRRLAFLASDRSAMNVTIDGQLGGMPFRRSWTLIAGRGDGPEIPVMAAQLLARKLREGTLAAGARDAGGLLSLTEFRCLYTNLAMQEEILHQSVPSLYPSAMLERFALLPAPVRAMHSLSGDGGAAGRGTVIRGGSLLARLTCDLLGFPPAGEYDVHVSFSECGGIERWTRRFGPYSFSSEMGPSPYDVAERFGPLRFHFELPVKDGRLEMVLRRWTAFGVPLPLLLAPRIHAFECAAGEDFVFDVAVAMPLLGPIVHYRGMLRRL